MDRIVLDKLIAPYVNSLPDHGKLPSFTTEQWDFVKGLVDFLTVKGVKIGGTYKHFKGTKYLVTGFVRDCENWDGEYLVEYVSIEDARHKAVRRISDFLGNVAKPEYKGPRFTLIS